MLTDLTCWIDVLHALCWLWLADADCKNTLCWRYASKQHPPSVVLGVPQPTNLRYRARRRHCGKYIYYDVYMLVHTYLHVYRARYIASVAIFLVPFRCKSLCSYHTTTRFTVKEQPKGFLPQQERVYSQYNNVWLGLSLRPTGVVSLTTCLQTWK